jgi:hypothetical protein
MVSVKRQEVDRRLDDQRLSAFVTNQISLRNAGEQQHRVLLIEPTPDGAWEIIEKSDGYQKLSQGIIFAVDVPARGEKIVSYTMRRPAQ